MYTWSAVSGGLAMERCSMWHVLMHFAQPYLETNYNPDREMMLVQENE